jgi:hypothetical protein
MVLGGPEAHEWLVPKLPLGNPLQAKLLLGERIIDFLRHAPQAGAWERGKETIVSSQIVVHNDIIMIRQDKKCLKDFIWV